MKIAFVGVRRSFQELADRNYLFEFVKYHLETPYYFSALGKNDVTVVTIDYSDGYFLSFLTGGTLRYITERQFETERNEYDVVVHWRSWFPTLSGLRGINLMHTCDHSYPADWIRSTVGAYRDGQLSGLLTHKGWHQRQMNKETGIPFDSLFLDCAQGVDDDVFRPPDDDVSKKDPYQMLWASDPGRGLAHSIELALRLYQLDRSFRLHVCWPDYSPRPAYLPNHPAIVIHGALPCRSELFDLFNTTGVFPYTSTFLEPSSRAHRQAQAAGSMVLYPPDMGSPSELIQSPLTGIVAPIQDWVRTIQDRVYDGSWRDIGVAARRFAVSQSWAVQSQNFNNLAARLLAEKGT